MEYEIFNIFKNNTLEVIIVAVVVFLLTYLIKWPIKKATSKLDENKRQMVNIIIVFIPLILSIISSVLYYGLVDKVWFKLKVFDSAFSSWIVSLSLYAIMSKIWIIVKGLFLGKIKISQNLTANAVKFLKTNAKEISKTIKVNTKDLEKIIYKIESLVVLKNSITGAENINLEELSCINSELNKYVSMQHELSKAIVEQKDMLQNYKNQLVNGTSEVKVV